MTTAVTGAVIFDLDGVITDTAEFHYQGWQRLADEHDLPFDRERNESLRGLSRRESLVQLLDGREVGDADLVEMMERKNRYYVDLLGEMTPADTLPGAVGLIVDAKRRGLPVAIGSSSRNARRVLDALELTALFDAIADGDTVERAKPAPDLFLAAAELVGVAPERCVVIEDAASGVDAALAAGMVAVGIGPAERVGQAHHRFATVAEADLAAIVRTEAVELDDGAILIGGWLLSGRDAGSPAAGRSVRWEVGRHPVLLGTEGGRPAGGAHVERDFDLRYRLSRHTVRLPEGPVRRAVDEAFTSFTGAGGLMQRQLVVADPGTVLDVEIAVDEGQSLDAGQPVLAGGHLRTEPTADAERSTVDLAVEVGEEGWVTLDHTPAYDVQLARHVTACDRWWRQVEVDDRPDPATQVAGRQELSRQMADSRAQASDEGQEGGAP